MNIAYIYADRVHEWNYFSFMIYSNCVYRTPKIDIIPFVQPVPA